MTNPTHTLSTLNMKNEALIILNLLIFYARKIIIGHVLFQVFSLPCFICLDFFNVDSKIVFLG